MPRLSAVRAAVVALLAPVALAACGVPDLVAHTVKQVEKSREQGRAMSQPAAAQQPDIRSPQPAPSRQAQAEEPPPIAVTMPRRESITVEALPER